jgi:hypothetical protein
MRRLGLVLALVAAGGGGAHASDGVREINQACAESAAGCFAGDPGGFPVVLSAPGSYALTSDLVVPAVQQDAIQIAADEVALDLRGFAIRGAYSCTLGCPPGTGHAGFGILRTGSGGDHTRVYGGGIRGFQFSGVVLGDNARVERLALFNLGGDGAVLGSYGLAFENTVNVTGGDGLVLGLGSLYRDNALGNLAGQSVVGGRASGSNTCNDEKCGTKGKELFYLTPGTFDGSQPLSACAAGFHMAAIQEIASLAEVEYDTTRGLTLADSGEGPPFVGGWVRRGGTVHTCQNWTSAVSGFPPSTGTAAQLGALGLVGPLGWGDPSVSSPLDYSCASPHPVWCVQD